MCFFYVTLAKFPVTMVKFLPDENLRKPNFSRMNSDADDKNLDSNGDLIFDPPAEMMIHDYDDERTIEEEEALENNEDPQIELSNLQREGEMPLSELLAMYGYNDNDNDNDNDNSDSEDLVSNPDTSLDKDLKDPLQADGQSDICLEENNETDPVEGETSELVKLYTDMPGGGVIDDAGGTSRLLRSVSRPQSEEEEDDCDYSPDEEEWKKTIMVGSDYQAKVPVGLCKYDDALPYENDDKMLWDPSPLTEKQTEEFLIKAHESLLNNVHVPPSAHVKDDEQALYLLLQCGYNVEEALRRRRINAVPPADTMSIWSEEECRNFETGMRMYGKDFHTIQKNKVRTRSVGELVQFYYLWKKTERHDVYAHKSRLEKKKYSLHPGITDYMDRFLEEQEVGSGHQDRSSSPNLHLLLYSDPKKRRLDEPEQASPAVDPLGGFVGHFGKENLKSFVKISATSELPVVAVDARDHEQQHGADRKSAPIVITLDEEDYAETAPEKTPARILHVLKTSQPPPPFEHPLAVPVELLLQEVLGEPDASHPIDASLRDFMRHLYKWKRCMSVLSTRWRQDCSGILFATKRILDKERILGEVKALPVCVLYLKVKYRLAELLPLQRVRQCDVEATLCETQHLGTDSYATFIQKSRRVLVTLAQLSQHRTLMYLRKRETHEGLDTAKRVAQRQRFLLGGERFAGNTPTLQSALKLTAEMDAECDKINEAVTVDRGFMRRERPLLEKNSRGINHCDRQWQQNSATTPFRQIQEQPLD